MITQSTLKEKLKYNPVTGIFTWRENVLYHKKHAGSIAGYQCVDNYVRIALDSKIHLAHRLSFLYMNGKFPEEVDHINHNRVDNRWVNLRSTTSTGNKRNLSMSRSNISGFTGVSWDDCNKKWRTKININGKTIHIGRFCNKEDAIKARKEANVKYGFHANHGKKPLKQCAQP